MRVVAMVIAGHAAFAALLLSQGLAPGRAPEPTMFFGESHSPMLPPSSANERARFLSGLRISETSPLAPLQRESWYIDHTANYAATWRNFDENYFSKMRAWSAAEITPRIGLPRVVFYLFGGPDFINAIALFPGARIYVLGGLEPVGEMPPPEQLAAGQLAAALENLRQSTSVTLQFSHFITRDMKSELEKTDFKGVLPILLSFLSLSGNEVLSVDRIGIDQAGIVGLTSDQSPRPGTVPGVRIIFRKSVDAPQQMLFYVKADLSDGGLKAHGGILEWMRTLAPGVSYLKAASYLMHEPYFSKVRTFLLANSRAILQDDSGIPLRAFERGQWKIYLFGAYNDPLELFQKYKQPDLAEMFTRPGAAFSLPFGTGYKWKPGESNLMLAVRPDLSSQPAPPPSGPPANPEIR